jgi:hypothetical protein
MRSSRMAPWLRDKISAAVEHAIGLLLRAAETGMRADRKAATDQVAVVLRFNMMLRFNM